MKRSALGRSSSLKRSSPLRTSKLAGKRRDTGPDAQTRALVAARAQWRCERCDLPCPTGGQWHHRRPRAMGGSRRVDTNSAANLIFLCPACHLGWVEMQRSEALLAGFLLNQHQDPASEPACLRGRWVYLTPEGTKVPA